MLIIPESFKETHLYQDLVAIDRQVRHRNRAMADRAVPASEEPNSGPNCRTAGNPARSFIYGT